MQQDDAEQRRGEQQQEPELDHSPAVNEILLKLLVTSMCATPFDRLHMLVDDRLCKGLVHALTCHYRCQ